MSKSESLHPFYGWTVSEYTNIHQHIYPFTDGHLGWSYLLATVGNVAMKCTYEFVVRLQSGSVGGALILFHWKTACSSSNKVAAPCSIPCSSVWEGLPSLTASPTLATVMHVLSDV